MVKIGAFNPHSTEGQYSLQMAVHLAHLHQPRTVLLCALDPEVAVSAAQRLGWAREGLHVEHPEIAEAIHQKLGMRARLADRTLEPDVALVLFSRQYYPNPPCARCLVSVGYNGLSYKSLLYPGQVRDNVIAQVRWFKRGYKPDYRVGLFGPGFLIRWALATIAGQRNSPLHFKWGQRAIDRLYSTTRAWWMGYMIVISGERCI